MLNGLGLPNLQGVYDAGTTPPHITVLAGSPLTVIEPSASSAAVTVAQTLGRDDGGSGANGDGVAQDLSIMNAAGALTPAFRVGAEWSDATAGSEDSEVVFSISIAGLFVEGLRFRAVGIDTQIASPFAFILSPNGDQDSGLRISTVANDVYVIPQIPSDEFFLGNTVADPSVDLNRGTSRAMSMIPLGTTLTAIGGGGGNWINFGSTTTIDYPSGSISGLVALSGVFQFRQNGGGAGAGNLFKNSGIIKNETGFNAIVGSQYTFVHVGVYETDGFAMATLFHRVGLHQPRWRPTLASGGTMTVVVSNPGVFSNPIVEAGVTHTSMRDFEIGALAQTGVIVNRNCFYVADVNSGSTETAAYRSLINTGATRRAVRATGTAQSDFGGPIGLGAGATVDVLLSRGAANRLDLATGDSFRIINGALEHLAGTIGFNGAAPVAQDTGWSISNLTTVRSYDANSTTLDELADVVGTLLTYLLSRGDIGA